MIRRDYILRMIEEFMRAWQRMHALRDERRWDEVGGLLDEEFQRLLGCDAATGLRLSESDMLARLMQDGPTYAVRDKTLMLTTLVKEAGDVAAAQNRTEEGDAHDLKALHLLLNVSGQGEIFDCPEFVPKVEMLVAALEKVDLTLRTQVMLMEHYERLGEFAKAEDMLFAMADADADRKALVEFGRAFYRRLMAQSDAALEAANLPRGEVESGLKELEALTQNH